MTDIETGGQLCWSPDGEVAGRRALAVQYQGRARNCPGASRRWRAPPDTRNERHQHSTAIRPFLPDGRLLAYASCTSEYTCDVFVQPVDPGWAARGENRRITQQECLIAGLAWTRDGTALIYGAGFAWGFRWGLWRVGSSGGRPPERLDLADTIALDPAVAPVGGRLAFRKATYDYDVWRYELGGHPEPFAKSSLTDVNGQFSPDGSRVVFASDRAGEVLDLWIADADGSHPVQLTRGPGAAQGSPRWSPDGRLIAFDSLQSNGQSKIYVVDPSGGRPRRISSETADYHNPSWSHDGRRIYSCSDRTGRWEVWRSPVDGGPAEQVTRNGGYQAHESADGRSLFYTKVLSGGPLFAQPVGGGPERQILDFVATTQFTVVNDGIYYIGRGGTDRVYPLQFYEFSTRASRQLAKVTGGLQLHLSVSPDRKTFLFTMTPTSGRDLMLLENFR